MDEIHVSIDVDKWEYGRTDGGQLTSPLLKSAYAHIEFTDHHELRRVYAIAQEYIEPDHNGQPEFISRGKYIFFQSKEDRDLVETLRLLH